MPPSSILGIRFRILEISSTLVLPTIQAVLAFPLTARPSSIVPPCGLHCRILGASTATAISRSRRKEKY
ncbi:unnamed protein product [Citrullus colocynthis]|uniref:Uncharacterized protein n=1 Tax=Citrullus colocynthis TaxID=252529 RepID=A0ABP0YKP9_9ROSI